MKKRLLIILFITTVLATNLLAQMELTIVGGINLATVRFNDSTVDNNYDISMKSGLNLGIETIGGPFIIGGAFIQRGVNIKVNTYDFEEFEGSDTYNYISGYLLYPISIQKQLSVFGGCQLGKFVSGTATYEQYDDSETNDLDAKEFALDFGFIFGADFMFNSNVGARGSYYIGLSNVISVEGFPSELNYKNSGIGICLLYKL